MPVLNWLFSANRSTKSYENVRSWSIPQVVLTTSPQVPPEGSTSSHGQSLPVSYNSPTDPTFRANSFPEVTNLICRLPLPTLFYRLEAVHLGDLLRIWVRSGRRFKIASLAFSRLMWSTRDTTGTAALYETSIPISGWATSRDKISEPEKRTLARTPHEVYEFACVTAQSNPCGPPSPMPGVGILTHFPFGNRVDKIP